MRPLDEAMRRAFWAAGASAVTLSSHAVEKAVQAALASLAADGWVPVPREATLDMCQAAHEAMFEDPWNGTNEGVGAGISAAIAAAPKLGGGA